MKVYTYSEARQRLARLLDAARKEEVLIRRRGGETFSVTYKTVPKSPFDVPGITTQATTADILEAIRESRSGEGKAGEPPVR
ncbi:MAG TPA: type II toxin-antitoxin system prevent-host-death family antitoxin [bacterium]|nr:type II toxin-antitoxin system prevent-host-death family antitoxin [bacterium]HQO35728.1 type II toxin-antitoxin system prevent-host-death family antitoxin [bacterium]HQQ00736.1 type II toxin-antitoxin system prevent-host-death family antitoxin [bacterium]